MKYLLSYSDNYLVIFFQLCSPASYDRSLIHTKILLYTHYHNIVYTIVFILGKRLIFQTFSKILKSIIQVIKEHLLFK